MGVPAGYIYKDGFYWGMDSDGPYGLTPAGLMVPLMGVGFASSWAGKPAASAVPVGTRVEVTDLNRTLWYSDGTNWRPVNGKAVLYNRMASYATPISTISHTDGSVRIFTLPETLRLPAGILSTPNTVLVVNGIIYRTAAGAGATTIFTTIKLGINNTSGDRNSNTLAFGAAVGAGISFYWEDHFPASNTSTGIQLTNIGAVPLTASNYFDIVDANYNTAADMYVNFAINAGAVSGDVTALSRYTVEIRA